MDKARVLIVLATLFLGLSLAMPAGAFVGAGVSVNKHLGDTLNFNFGNNINALNTGYSLTGLNIGVDWGVDVDVGSMAGYPYGYGGLGSVTVGDLGYNLGVTVDQAVGTGFDGSAFGLPIAQGDLQTTHLGQFVQNNRHIEQTQVMLPFAFPVLA
ncbi:hypothetical protein CUJ83_02670 [Methanocella sp. CWC-04]|uniref:Uncharacterized protein n=1 Tax=Methanooceanicella nereidis TaxID=2052831 RepID=A0AAP2RC78_9EURY|nr:hypothetical protein [Methanocella sp. CWC-04]MCD1293900.1 hypothetical protein [Methanocella sp. CWC-04]